MSEAVSILCRSCGLCCDGTLFAHVSLTADEAAALRERDLALESRRDGSFRLPQRCRALEGKVCAVYPNRPKPCAAYVCLLAQALSEGEIRLDEARATVEGAHDKLAALREELPGSDPLDSPVSALRRSLHGEGSPLTEAAEQAWDDAREYLRRHFTGRSALKSSAVRGRSGP